MGITALLLTAALDAGTAGATAPISCGFPAAALGEAPIRVEIAATPSLRDLEGQFHVNLALNDAFRLTGTAQPMTLEDGPAILIGGNAAAVVFYTIGLRPNGTAALTIRDTGTGGEVTRLGACRDHERYLRLWLLP